MGNEVTRGPSGGMVLDMHGEGSRKRASNPQSVDGAIMSFAEYSIVVRGASNAILHVERVILTKKDALIRARELHKQWTKRRGVRVGVTVARTSPLTLN